MKKLAILVTALCVGSLSFAASSGSNRQGTWLNALTSAWKSAQSTQTQSVKPDSHMIYGGVDISPKATLISPTAVA